MPAQVLISILIPIYNVQDYLEECLDSVCAQTFGDFEAICINDGSTDNSREIVERYLKKDGRFRLIDKANSGYGASMNRGLDAASGNYIAILESDDFFEAQTLERLYGAIREFEAEVVMANCYFYWAGPPKRNISYGLTPRSQVGRLINPQKNHEIFYRGPAVWAALYDNNFLKTHDIRFNETPGASYQDLGFHFKVWAMATRAIFLRDAFVHYRQSNKNSSVKASGKIYSVCEEFAEINRYLAALPEIPEWLKAVKAKLKFITYVWNYERLADEFQLEFLQRFASEMRLELEEGNIDWSLFEKWDTLELQNILNSPEEYHKKRQASGRGKLGKLKHIFKIGGLPLLISFGKNRFLRRG